MYDPQKKFGFIVEYETGTSYFFHISNITHPFHITPLQSEVSFIASKTEKGLAAICIEEYIPKISGKFSDISYPNVKQTLTNVDRLAFLTEQRKKTELLLQKLQAHGMSATIHNNWLSLDTSILSSLKEPAYKDGHIKTDVPSGYCATARYLIRALQQQINHLNHDYTKTYKGLQGEEKTLHSLLSVSLDYPVMNNVRFELTNHATTYSAESDIIIITPYAVFVIETKNFGGKGDRIDVSPDGRWSLYDGYSRKTRTLNNPFKQSTDHIFAMRKFFSEHSISLTLPIVPIIAIANDDVALNIPTQYISSIMRADMVGTYILNYINTTEEKLPPQNLSNIAHIISEANLPPKQYTVVDYYNNIVIICDLLKELFKYWSEDEIISQKIEQEEMQRVRQATLQKEQQEQLSEKLGEAIGLIGGILSIFMDL